MLKQLYVDNFRAFVNFTLPLGSKQLLLGRNGTGKSSVLDVLRGIKQLVVDAIPLPAHDGDLAAGQVFYPKTLTRWQTTSLQTFELMLDCSGGAYTYRLEIEYREKTPCSRIVHESLKLDAKPLFEFERGRVQLFRDNHSEGPAYPFDWGGSALATIHARDDNTKLTVFKERLANVLTIRLDAPHIEPTAQREVSTPDESMRDFVAWYRGVSGDAERVASYLSELRSAISGLKNLKLDTLGRAKLLRALFDPTPGSEAGRQVGFDLDELSDGQRALVALYALLHFGLGRDTTLVIDEPDNYVSLDEIQPWLLRVLDEVDERGAQVIFASHHPELLDMLARDHGIKLERDGVGPIRAMPFEGAGGSALPPSEQVARGWDRE